LDSSSTLSLQTFTSYWQALIVEFRAEQKVHTLRAAIAALIMSEYVGWEEGFFAFADPPARFFVAFAGAAGAATASDILANNFVQTKTEDKISHNSQSHD